MTQQREADSITTIGEDVLLLRDVYAGDDLPVSWSRAAVLRAVRGGSSLAEAMYVTWVWGIVLRAYEVNLTPPLLRHYWWLGDFPGVTYRRLMTCGLKSTSRSGINYNSRFEAWCDLAEAVRRLAPEDRWRLMVGKHTAEEE